MNIKIVKKGKEKMEFVLGGSSISFANALRRIMVSEVPVLAIDWLEVEENNSAIFDEMIAQRMGLIPLSFDPEKFNFQDGCKCGGKGCTLCQVVFVVEKTGPCMVYSKDMKSSNKGVMPASPDFPITELLEGQRLKLEATARLGIGKEHAKFQAANAVYQNHPETIDGKINTKPEEFLFIIESLSSLPPDYIVSKAADILAEKAQTFKKEAAKL